MKKIIMAVAALTLVAMPTASWAKKGKGGGADPFTAADTNTDGSLSKEEAAAATPPIAEARFTKMDKDGDGKLSKSEFDAAMAAAGKKGKKKKAPEGTAPAE